MAQISPAPHAIECQGGCGASWPFETGQPAPPPLVDMALHRAAGLGLSDDEIKCWNDLVYADRPIGSHIERCLPCALDLLVALAGIWAPIGEFMHPTQLGADPNRSAASEAGPGVNLVDPS